MPKFCPTCGKPLPFEEVEVCPGCGVRIRVPPVKKTSDHSLNKGLLIIAILCVLFVVVLIVAAVIAAFVFGMAGSSTAPVQTTEISQLPVPVYSSATLAPSVQALPRPIVQGWNRYTIPQTRVGIYMPKDWTTTSKAMSFGGKDYTILISYSPDATTAVGAFSMDVTGIIGGQASLQKILHQGYIDSDMYQGFIKGLTSGSTSSPMVNVIQDPHYYAISGYPARRVEYDQENAHFVDYVIVVDKNTMVLELMTFTSQATYDDRMKGEASLKSVSG